MKGLPRIEAFVGRTSEMKQLEAILLPDIGHDSERQKLAILYGMGGIGKTQLAVEFARKYCTRFTSVFWLDGRSERSLKHSIADIAGRIPKGQISEASRTYTQRSNYELDEVVRDVLNWFSIEDHQNWLLIFDNVDNTPMSNDADAYDINDYIPGADHGSILVTTRLFGLLEHGKRVEMTTVDDDDALAILEQRSAQNLKGRKT